MHAKLIPCESKYDIITHSGLMARAFPVESAESAQLFDISNDLKYMSDEFSFDFQNAGYISDGVGATMRVLPKKSKCSSSISDILQKDVPEKYFIKEDKLDKWKYLKGAKKIPRISSGGYAYTYSEGAVAFPDYLDKPSRTILTGEGTVSRSSHVVLDPQTNRLRTLTPIEVERLQGFPDNWTNTGMSERMRYFCMGNALVVPTVKRIARVINELVAFENRYHIICND